MVKMGVVGVGHLGKRHAELIKRSNILSLEGIYDAQTDVADEVGNSLSCRVFATYDDLLDKVEAISVVVPTDQHYDVACKAANAGVHMLIEKPITSRLEEAEEIIALSESNNVVLQVGHVERFNPAFRLAVGHINHPLFIESHRLSPFVERGTEVDVILDLMIHDIDLVLTLMGSDASDIWSIGVPVVTSSVDIANTRLTFADNHVASLTASRISRKRMRKLRIFQRDTYISMDLLNRKSEMYRIVWEGASPQLKEKVFESDGTANPLADEINSFARSVRDNTPPRVTGEEAMRALSHAVRIREKMSVPPPDGSGREGN